MLVSKSNGSISLNPEADQFDTVTGPTGFASVAQDYYFGALSLDDHLIINPSATFLLRVVGDSMSNAGFFDGDEILVDRSLEPTDGRIVVAVWGDGLMIRRLALPRRDRAELHAANPGYPVIATGGLGELEIWGVVTRCLHYA